LTKNQIFVGLVAVALSCHPALAQKGQAKKPDAKEKPAPSAPQAQQPDPVQSYLQHPSNQGYLRARAHLDTLLAKNPNDYQSLVSSFYVDQANVDAQVNALYAVRDSLDAATTFSLANFLLAAKDYGRAITIYEQLNAKTPKWSCPWRHKGQALYEQGKLDEAEQALIRATEARDTHYDAYVWLARVRRDLKRYDEALETMKTAFAVKYKDVEDPTKEIKADEDIQLMDDLLLQNMVQPDQVEAERNKIIKAYSKTKRP
jgi:tetratricopeptide (TPR) repeat protein